MQRVLFGVVVAAFVAAAPVAASAHDFSLVVGACKGKSTCSVECVSTKKKPQILVHAVCNNHLGINNTPPEIMPIYEPGGLKASCKNKDEISFGESMLGICARVR